MGFVSWADPVLTGVILLAGVADDLRSRKIHNTLILVLLAVAVAGVFLIKGLSGLLVGGMAGCLALTVGIPLYMAKIMGGGDLKLLFVFSLTVTWLSAGMSLMYSFPWALLLGLFKIILAGQLRDFLFNLFFLVKFQKPDFSSLHTIPFSLSLFLGWLTFISLKLGGLW